MLQILGRYRDELGAVALPEEFEAAARRAEEHLATKAAQIEVENVRNVDDRLNFDITVRNLAGHKLPTAYPSRRVWLHVVVRDENNRIVFESGRSNMDGSIEGNDNDRDGTLFEPHYLQITDPGQVQIYESIMADFQSEVTTGLVFSARYLKDSRVPPLGFAKENVPHEVAVIGSALEDPDFGGGSDTTHFDIPFLIRVWRTFSWSSSTNPSATAGQRILKNMSPLRRGASRAISTRMQMRQPSSLRVEPPG